jgi:NNP family nitrate/nitrite transporter-like MFS transporter
MDSYGRARRLYRQAFHLSPGQKGLVVAVPLLGGSILRVILGIAADHFGPRKVGLTGLTLTLIPLLWGWMHSTSIADLIGIGLMLGVAGASFAVALPLVSRWYPPRLQGLVLGIAGAGNSGTVLAILFAPYLAERFGWRSVFAIAAIPIAIVLAIFLRFAEESPNRPPAGTLRDYLGLLRQSDLWWFNGFYMVTFGGFVGLASFLPIFFFDQYNVSRAQAGAFGALCVFSGSLLRPLGGFLADRFGGIKILSTLYALVMLLLLGIAMMPVLPAAVGLLFGIMICLGTGNGAVFQLVPQRFSDQIGVATGLIGAAGGLGGFFLPTLLGGLKSIEGSYAAGLIVFAIAAGCAMLAVLNIGHGWQNLILRAVVQLGPARGFMGRNLLRVLQRAAVLQVGTDAGGTKCVAAVGLGQGGASGSPLDHREDILPRHRILGQLVSLSDRPEQ